MHCGKVVICTKNILFRYLPVFAPFTRSNDRSGVIFVFWDFCPFLVRIFYDSYELYLFLFCFLPLFFADLPVALIRFASRIMRAVSSPNTRFSFLVPSLAGRFVYFDEFTPLLLPGALGVVGALFRPLNSPPNRSPKSGRTRHSAPLPMRSSLPAIFSASLTRFAFSGRAYWSSAR